MPPALELRNIVKRFPGVVANDRVSFSVEAGEIRALVGENGAGKSTLMNILYGLLQPDEGEIYVEGERMQFHSPLDAIRSGLGMVHQHFMLFPSLTVAENIIYGIEPSHFGVVDKRTAEESVAELAERYGLDVDAGSRIENLPVGVRQRVEILKMLYRGADILILDEPTAVLTPAERQSLFAVLRSLAAAGKTIVFITHKLPEVLDLSDTATALRDGAVTGTVRTADSSEKELCRLMVGRDVELHSRKGEGAPRMEPILSVHGLHVHSTSRKASVRGVDLAVRAGEILGIAGAAGNGQAELVEAIAGLRPVAAGSISLSAADVTDADVATRRQMGQSHIPENRDEVGLAVEASLSDNLLMGFEDREPYSRRGILSKTAIDQHTKSLLTALAVKSASPDEAAGNLSGGNRQKLVIAREMAHQARLLIAEQPTRGVDIGATEQIYDLLVEYRDRGNAILLVSTDLTEVLNLSDRILVMFEGRIVGEMSGDEATEEGLGLLMGGGSGD